MSKFLLSVLFISLVAASCNKKPDKLTNPRIDKLKLLPGFEAEHLYSPGENEQGSWVAMTFDNKGRMITSDQYGAIISYCVTCSR
jgi:hypothetical protein